jgi:hypothetical protein
MVGICPGDIRENFLRKTQLGRLGRAFYQIVIPPVSSDRTWKRRNAIAFGIGHACDNMIQAFSFSVVMGKCGHLLQLKETVTPSSIEVDEKDFRWM